MSLQYPQAFSGVCKGLFSSGILYGIEGDDSHWLILDVLPSQQLFFALLDTLPTYHLSVIQI